MPMLPDNTPTETIGVLPIVQHGCNWLTNLDLNQSNMQYLKFEAIFERFGSVY
jgi:hypothetical protein